jgi:uncharacterized protein
MPLKTLVKHLGGQNPKPPLSLVTKGGGKGSQMRDPDRLAASSLRHVLIRYRDALHAHRDELNSLNVFPVPDGDAGTNMAMTLDSVVGELDSPRDMAELCRAVSRGALMGARGNSGVILSQVLHGVAKVLGADASASGCLLAAALREASVTAYDAVTRPREGTILTVVRAAADAAARICSHAREAPPAEVLDAAADAAQQALAATTELLPELKKAGVVDAGGKGFTLLLESFLAELQGRPISKPERVARPQEIDEHLDGDGIVSPRYEVMFFLRTPDEAMPRFKGEWHELGDSIVIAGGEGLYKCHIHTDDIGAAIEAAIAVGRPKEIQVTDLVLQAERERRARAAGTPTEEVPSRPRSAVIGVAPTEAIAQILTGLGAAVVIRDGSGIVFPIETVVEAIDSCAADSVLVLPGDERTANEVRRGLNRVAKRVRMVPAASVVESMAALTAFDPGSEIESNLTAMNEAAARVRPGQVLPADPPEEGWLAFDRGGVVATKGSAFEAAVVLLDRLIGDDTEVVTVLLGEGAGESDTTAIKKYLKGAHPHVVGEFHQGGQPLPPYLFGVE